MPRREKHADLWRVFDAHVSSPKSQHANNCLELETISSEQWSERQRKRKRPPRGADEAAEDATALVCNSPSEEVVEVTDPLGDLMRLLKVDDEERSGEGSPRPTADHEADRYASIVWKPSVEESGTCTACGEPVAISELGFLICTGRKCGAMYTDCIDTSAEWRFYSGDDSHRGSDPTRCGMPINPLLRESSYGCSVAGYGRMSYQMRKIKRYTEWQSMPYKEKARYDEFQTISIMANNAGLPKIIIDHAMRIHMTISEIQKFRGINRDGIIAASIYISCRKNEYPRTAREIASMFMLDNKSATRGCKNAMTIMNELEIRDGLGADDSTVHCETTPATFIDRFCSKLDVHAELAMLCKFVALKVEQMRIIPENTPHAISTGVIYLVAQCCVLDISKKDICAASEISEVTINKCYKKLAPYASILVPDIMVQKYAGEKRPRIEDAPTQCHIKALPAPP